MNSSTPIGLTVRELARCTRTPRMVLQHVLDEMAGEGLVEHDGQLWRLTRGAEREFGAALRGLWPITRDDVAEAAKCFTNNAPAGAAKR